MKIDNFKDEFGNYKKYITENSKRVWTKSGQTWNAMRARCKEGGCVQNSFESYVGCSMSTNFKNYNFFVGWHEKQIGFNLDGYDLDKDLLFAGNKLYSEDTCVLIPCQLNSFLTIFCNGDSNLPQGVRNSGSGTYRSQIKINGKNKELGTYKTIVEAFAAYKIAKESEAHRWYNRLVAGEFVVDPRVIERMKNWTLET